jgi:iron complex transport system permease protein
MIRAGSVATITTLALVTAALAVHNISATLPSGSWSGLFAPDPAITAQVLAHYTILPRIFMALMAGAGLGLAGALLQHILRNPLAEPATLGISASAYLMLAVAGVFFPAAAAMAREWITFAGAALALSAILILSWKRALSPVTVTLSGLIISLYCGAASALLGLFFQDFLIGEILWGAGYLDQQDWSGVAFLAPRLALAALAAALLVRPLTLLALGDGGARSLGLSLVAYRLLGLLVATMLTAIVTAAVGIISFVGLAAPALARAIGARRVGGHLLWSAVIGALLLAMTDQMVLSLPVTFRIFPTGAVTALFGAPLLLMLLRRLPANTPSLPTPDVRPARLQRPVLAIVILAGLLPILAWLALTVGQGPDGWSYAEGEELTRLLVWRGPRVLAAFSGGAMLALAGAILQRMTGNAMASPEVLGVSSGAMLGVILLMLTASAPTRTEQIIAGAVGAFTVHAFIAVLAAKPGYSGDKLLLVGIALSSVCGFFIAVLMVTQDPRFEQLLAWMSGSTYAVRPFEAALSTLVLAVGLCCIPLVRRWLALLPLGLPVAISFGVPQRLSRNALLSLAATLTAGATILIGPLSFSGLMGPHLAKLAGFHRGGTQLLASALLGGLILIIADWIGRNAIFPFQIPAGLLATMVGGPFLLLLIGRRP